MDTNLQVPALEDTNLQVPALEDITLQVPALEDITLQVPALDDITLQHDNNILDSMQGKLIYFLYNKHLPFRLKSNI